MLRSGGTTRDREGSVYFLGIVQSIKENYGNEYLRFDRKHIASEIYRVVYLKKKHIILESLLNH